MTCKKLVDSRPASIGEIINVLSSNCTFFGNHAEREGVSDLDTNPYSMANLRLANRERHEEG